MVREQHQAQWQALYDGLTLGRFGVSLSEFRSDPYKALTTAARHPSWNDFARRHMANATMLAAQFTARDQIARGTEADRERGTELHARHDAMVRRFQA